MIVRKRDQKPEWWDSVSAYLVNQAISAGIVFDEAGRSVGIVEGMLAAFGLASRTLYGCDLSDHEVIQVLQLSSAPDFQSAFSADVFEGGTSGNTQPETERSRRFRLIFVLVVHELLRMRSPWWKHPMYALRFDPKRNIP